MRPLVLLILLAVAGAAAAEEERPAGFTTRMATPGSGSSMPMEAGALPSPRARTVRPAVREDEAQRRLMMLLMMRRAADAFPSALLRQPD